MSDTLIYVDYHNPIEKKKEKKNQNSEISVLTNPIDCKNSCVVCNGIMINKQATFICGDSAHFDCLGFLKYYAEKNNNMAYYCLKCREERKKWETIWEDKDKKIPWKDRVFLLGKQQILHKELFKVGEEKITLNKLTKNEITFDIIFQRGISLAQIFYELRDKSPYTYQKLGLKLEHFKKYKNLAHINWFLAYCDLTWYTLQQIYPKISLKSLNEMGCNTETLKLLNVSFDSLLMIAKNHDDIKNLKLSLSELCDIGCTNDLCKECIGDFMESFSYDGSKKKRK